MGLFSKISNAEIEQIVGATLGSDLGLREQIIALNGFAEANRLGSWKRSRITAEITAFACTQMSPRAARAMGDAYGFFLSGYLRLDRLYWKAFEGCMNGALQVLNGWDLESTRFSGSGAVADYILHPAQRAIILESYRQGWALCGDKRLTVSRVTEFKRQCASVAATSTGDERDMVAAMRGEISPAAMEGFRAQRVAEETVA